MDDNKLEHSSFDLGSIISEEEYYENFGDWLHPFTGVNMVDYYKDLCQKENCEVQFVFSNKTSEILNYTNDVLTCDIHTRYKTKESLKNKGANVYSLMDVLNAPIDNSGFNPKYGLLGSNKSTEERLKLFPKTGDTLV